jgi:hypothetical protein
MKQMPFPKKGMPKEEVLSLLRSFKADGSDWHQGRLFGLVYYALPEGEASAKEAYAAYPPSLHMTVSPYHEQIVEPFLADFRETAAELMKSGAEESSGGAALYGMMGTMPDRKTAKALALQYLNDLYRLKE